MKTNFILVKVTGTVTSTKTQILNSNYVKRVYVPDGEQEVKVDYVGDDGKVVTMKVTHTLREMWGKLRGVHI